MVVPATTHCGSWVCGCGSPSVLTAIHDLGVVSADGLLAYAVAERDFFAVSTLIFVVSFAVLTIF